MANLYYTRWWTPVTRSLAVLGAALFTSLVELCARELKDSISNTLERYACAFVFTQLVLLVALVMGLVVVKWLGLRLSERRDARRREIEEMIVACAAGGDVEQCAARLRHSYTDTVHVMDRAMSLVHGAERVRLEELLIEGGFVPPLIRDASNSYPNRAIQ